MFCPWCGAQNPDEAAVCQKCGRALRPAGPLPVAPASAAGGYPQGFFARLFDFSFRGFITPTIISIIYGIVVVLCAFGAIALIGVAFRAGTAAGVITLILSPI
ncbi:MAG: zinc-ribbon domain-containing protein, partial [Chloroflexia bacterium]